MAKCVVHQAQPTHSGLQQLLKDINKVTLHIS